MALARLWSHLLQPAENHEGQGISTRRRVHPMQPRSSDSCAAEAREAVRERPEPVTRPQVAAGSELGMKAAASATMPTTRCRMLSDGFSRLATPNVLGSAAPDWMKP